MIVEDIEKTAESPSGGSTEDLCQVRTCRLPHMKEACDVTLWKESGEEFLFSAFFCEKHAKGFYAAPAILAEYIRRSLIRGVDPKILR